MLLDERKMPESIEAATYGRYNDSARDEIARQMAEFEKRNKVTTCPIGAMASGVPITKQKNLDEINAGRDNHKRERAKSGHLNVHLDENTGKHVVCIARNYIGTYDTADEAVEARDIHRAKVGMSKAAY